MKRGWRVDDPPRLQLGDGHRYAVVMLYTLIERYSAGPRAVYERAATHGRMLPDGLRYLDSWVVDDGNLARCFQLIETDDPALVDAWLERWSDLTDFEIYPVIKSDEAAARVDVMWEPNSDGS